MTGGVGGWERERTLRDVRSSLLEAIDSTAPDRDVLVRSLLERFEDEVTGQQYRQPAPRPLAPTYPAFDGAAVAVGVCVAAVALVALVWVMAGSMGGLVMLFLAAAGVAVVAKAVS